MVTAWLFNPLEAILYCTEEFQGAHLLTGERFPIMRNAVSVESKRKAIRLLCPAFIKGSAPSKLEESGEVLASGRGGEGISLMDSVQSINSWSWVGLWVQDGTYNTSENTERRSSLFD
jgi:hypothetical protein